MTLLWILVIFNTTLVWMNIFIILNIPISKYRISTFTQSFHLIAFCIISLYGFITFPYKVFLLCTLYFCYHWEWGIIIFKICFIHCYRLLNGDNFQLMKCIDLKCSPSMMSSDTCVHTCHHHPKQGIECSHHPASSSCPVLVNPSTPTPAAANFWLLLPWLPLLICQTFVRRGVLLLNIIFDIHPWCEVY